MLIILFNLLIQLIGSSGTSAHIETPNVVSGQNNQTNIRNNRTQYYNRNNSTNTTNTLTADEHNNNNNVLPSIPSTNATSSVFNYLPFLTTHFNNYDYTKSQFYRIVSASVSHLDLMHLGTFHSNRNPILQYL